MTLSKDCVNPLNKFRISPDTKGIKISHSLDHFFSNEQGNARHAEWTNTPEFNVGRFVDSDASMNHTLQGWMLNHRFQLSLNFLRMSVVIAVHECKKITFGLLHSKIFGEIGTSRSGPFERPVISVLLRRVVSNTKIVIGRAVINDNQFQIFVGLIQDAVNCNVEQRVSFVSGHDHGNPPN